MKKLAVAFAVLTYSGFHTRGSIARAGLNYKFDWAGPMVARY